MISTRHLWATGIVALTLAIDVNAPAFAHPTSSVQRSSSNNLVRHPANNTYNVLHTFNSNDGSAPAGDLDLGVGVSHGTTTRTIYGETLGGGSQSSGTIFSYVLSANTFASLYSFTDGNDGGSPTGGLANNETNYFAAGSTQFGVGQSGGSSGFGTLFAVGSNGVPTIVHTFTGGTDGAFPAGRLTYFTDGNYYGTTTGGALGYGTVYRLSPSGVFTTIYAFTNGVDGGSPQAGLALRVGRFDTTRIELKPTINATVERMVMSSPSLISPYLYGTTTSGGAADAGTVFRISAAGKLQTLHTFTGGTDGASPAARLTTDLYGNLFGSTQFGGSGGNGVIFVIPAGRTASKVIYDFGTGATGAIPQAQITLGFNGDLYGTTSQGGASGEFGDIYEITSNGSFYDIHDFSDTDGSFSQGGLVDGGDGNLYGTTTAGGVNAAGGPVLNLRVTFNGERSTSNAGRSRERS